jgi:protease IV
MREFFKFMFASMVGTLILMGISSLIFIVMLVTLISSAQKMSVPLKENSVLHIKLDETIYDRSSTNPLDNFDFNKMKTSGAPGLNDILTILKSAADDERISGILLDLTAIPSGIATIEEIREAVFTFKKSGKFVYAYSENFMQSSYYLATTADCIYMNPEGSLVFKGLSAQIFFIKGLLEKIEVQPQIVRHGKYKSAVEPFISDKMSEENREQTAQVVNSLWHYMLEEISQARGINVTALNNIADSLLVTTARAALKYGLVDGLMYKDELLAALNEQLGKEPGDKIQFVSLAKYNKAIKTQTAKFSKDKIAVVFAQGEIVSGDGDSRSIGSEKISEAIRQARIDKNVKAIVLRVNSPGGSALASEVIWREVALAAAEKPVVASMGDLAASGGYYIACGATKILANPNTITGSIGVFGIVPNMENMFKNKLGITFETVNTNKHSDYISVTRGMKSYEEAVLLAEIETIYATFIQHVAEGRKMTEEQVDSVGQGRIWSGVDALALGLIDDFGGLEKAIEEAAKLAEIEEYRIVAYPTQKDGFLQIIEQLTGEEASMARIEKELGSNYAYYKYMKYVTEMKGTQARIPYDINIY